MFRNNHPALNMELILNTEKKKIVNYQQNVRPAIKGIRDLGSQKILTGVGWHLDKNGQPINLEPKLIHSEGKIEKNIGDIKKIYDQKLITGDNYLRIQTQEHYLQTLEYNTANQKQLLLENHTIDEQIEFSPNVYPEKENASLLAKYVIAAKARIKAHHALTVRSFLLSEKDEDEQSLDIMSLTTIFDGCYLEKLVLHLVALEKKEAEKSKVSTQIAVYAHKVYTDNDSDIFTRIRYDGLLTNKKKNFCIDNLCLVIENTKAQIKFLKKIKQNPTSVYGRGLYEREWNRIQQMICDPDELEKLWQEKIKLILMSNLKDLFNGRQLIKLMYALTKFFDDDFSGQAVTKHFFNYLINEDLYKRPYRTERFLASLSNYFSISNVIAVLKQDKESAEWLFQDLLDAQNASIESYNKDYRAVIGSSILGYERLLEICEAHATEDKVDVFSKAYQQLTGRDFRKASPSASANRMTLKQALELFELDESADYQKVRVKYKKFALQYHPDKAKLKASSNIETANDSITENANKFAEYTVAFNILREFYDNPSNQQVNNEEEIKPPVAEEKASLLMLKDKKENGESVSGQSDHALSQAGKESEVLVINNFLETNAVKDKMLADFYDAVVKKLKTELQWAKEPRGFYKFASNLVISASRQILDFIEENSKESDIQKRITKLQYELLKQKENLAAKTIFNFIGYFSLRRAIKLGLNAAESENFSAINEETRNFLRKTKNDAISFHNLQCFKSSLQRNFEIAASNKAKPDSYSKIKDKIENQIKKADYTQENVIDIFTTIYQIVKEEGNEPAVSKQEMGVAADEVLGRIMKELETEVAPAMKISFK